MADLEIAWVRGNDRLNFSRPQRWFALGIVGSGKSSFLECLGEHNLASGNTVLDLYGSRDGEGLAWLRSPHIESKKVLLLHGDNVDVSSSFDAKNVSKLTLADLENFDILVSATPLYISPSQEYREVNRVLDLLYKRQSYARLVHVIVREAANIFYSRLRVSRDQLLAKSEATYLLRESRHMGLSLGLDSLRFYSIDIDVRSVCDYEVIKSLGLFGLPDDLEWLYHIVNPPFIRHMPLDAFVVLSKTGSIGLGTFKEIPWHKREKENILKAVGVKVEYGEEPELGEDRGTFRTIGDSEHSEIIALYVEEKQSMHRIADLKHRSTATIQAQIRAHDEAIARSGFCAKCRRANGRHDTAPAKSGQP